MKRLMTATVMATAGLMIGASAAHAQGPDPLTKGRTSIAFSIPESGTNSFGIWKQLSQTRALGLQATVVYGRQDTDFDGDGNDADLRDFQISVAPAMKW